MHSFWSRSDFCPCHCRYGFKTYFEGTQGSSKGSSHLLQRWYICFFCVRVLGIFLFHNVIIPFQVKMYLSMCSFGCTDCLTIINCYYLPYHSKLNGFYFTLFLWYLFVLDQPSIYFHRNGTVWILDKKPSDNLL